jgi:hypothetical protein
VTIAEESQRLRERASLLDRLAQEFPGLEERRLRWRTVLVSPAVNASPERCYTAHSCGCCDDAALYAYFCVERHGEKVYTDPPFVWVGQRDRDGWLEDWEDRVRRQIGESAVSLARIREREKCPKEE